MMLILVFAAALTVCSGQGLRNCPTPMCHQPVDLSNMTKFNCSDGTVLEMDQVCDGKDDCRKFYGHHAEDEEPILCAGPDFFICGDWEQTTISISKKCDGTNDCPMPHFYTGDMVADDETSYACAGPDQFACDDMKTIIELNQKCDGINDCPKRDYDDRETSYDERSHLCAGPEEFACHDGDTIIPADKKCNGENDCPQRYWYRRSKTEDEEPHMCKGPDQFVCSDGETIVDNNKRCDGVPDCPKRYHFTGSGYREVAEDEIMQDCIEDDEFLCSDGTTVIKQTQLCDDVPDCPLRNATQNLWYGRSHQHSKIAEDEGDKCPERHVCSDGQTVIEKTQICDDVPDCPVNNNSYYLVAEDESHMCPGRHVCSDRKTVINQDQICDGVEDCPVTNNSYYLVAEDETHMCPEKFVCGRGPKVINRNQTCDNVSDCTAWDEYESECERLKSGSTPIPPIFIRPMPGGTGSTRPTTIRCPFDENNKQIDLSQMCDGVPDCVGEDEAHFRCLRYRAPPLPLPRPFTGAPLRPAGTTSRPATDSLTTMEMPQNSV